MAIASFEVADNSLIVESRLRKVFEEERRKRERNSWMGVEDVMNKSGQSGDVCCFTDVTLKVFFLLEENRKLSIEKSVMIRDEMISELRI